MKELSCTSTETGALILLFENKNKLKYLSLYFICENHSNIKNFLVTFFLRIKMFLFYGNLSDKMTLIKWISHWLFTILPWCHKVNALIGPFEDKNPLWQYVIKHYITYISPDHSRLFPSVSTLYGSMMLLPHWAASLVITLI